jgi:hypothetical protein
MLYLPLTATLSAVWNFERNGDNVLALESAGHQHEVLSQHRLIRPGADIPILVVRSLGLRDGGVCSLIWSDGEAEAVGVQEDLRLAGWDLTQTRPVVRFLLSQVVPSLPDAVDRRPFQRFLSRISSWRAGGEGAVAVEGLSIGVLPLAPGVLKPFATVYAVEADQVVARSGWSVTLDDSRTALVIAGPPCTALFIEIGENLIEVDFRGTFRSDTQAAWHWGKHLLPEARARLLSVLDEAGSADEPPVDLVTAVAGSLPVTVRVGDGEVSILGCIHTGATLFIFVEVTGGNSIEAMTVQPLGGEETELGPERFRSIPLPAADALRREPNSYTRCVAQLDHAPLMLPACRLTGVIGGEPIEAWIPVQTRPSAASRDLVRTFWPTALVNNAFLEEVARPIFALPGEGAGRGKPYFLEIGQAPERPLTVTYVISDGTLEPLDRTLVALSLTSGERGATRIILADPHHAEAFCERVRGWFQAYGLVGGIDVLAADSQPDAFDVIRATPGEITAILMAGHIPRSPAWLEQARLLLSRDRASILVGAVTDPAGDPKHGTHAQGAPILTRASGTQRLSPRDLLDTFQARMLGALVFPSASAPELTGTAPVCLTHEGVLIEALLAWLNRGGQVLMHGALAMRRAGLTEGDVAFDLRYDVHVLRELAAEGLKRKTHRGGATSRGSTDDQRPRSGAVYRPQRRKKNSADPTAGGSNG